MRATLQSFLHIRWPTLASTVPSSRPPSVSFENKASELERKSLASCEGGFTRTVTTNATVITEPPDLPYDSSRCNQECPLCTKRFAKDSRKELAKHVNKHSPNPDHPRFKSWLVASQRSWCSVCASSYSQRQLHECKGPRRCPEASSSPLQSTPPADPQPEVRPEAACILPEWMEIFATSIPSVKRVPQQVAKAFSAILRNCAVSGTKEQELRAWKLQFLFPKCVLRVQPEVRRKSSSVTRLCVQGCSRGYSVGTRAASTFSGQRLASSFQGLKDRT